jgi:hypothetical protein
VYCLSGWIPSHRDHHGVHICPSSRRWKCLSSSSSSCIADFGTWDIDLGSCSFREVSRAVEPGSKDAFQSMNIHPAGHARFQFFPLPSNTPPGAILTRYLTSHETIFRMLAVSLPLLCITRCVLIDCLASHLSIDQSFEDMVSTIVVRYLVSRQMARWLPTAVALMTNSRIPIIACNSVRFVISLFSRTLHMDHTLTAGLKPCIAHALKLGLAVCIPGMRTTSIYIRYVRQTRSSSRKR